MVPQIAVLHNVFSSVKIPCSNFFWKRNLELSNPWGWLVWSSIFMVEEFRGPLFLLPFLQVPFLHRGGVRRVVVGHKPSGEAPAMLRTSGVDGKGYEVISADTNYASTQVWGLS